MTDPETISITLEVVEAFDRAGVPYMVSGSLASSVYGLARTTMDVDMVANIQPGQVVRIVELLKDNFYVDRDMILDAIKHKSSFNVIHLETMFKADIYILQDRAFDGEEFARRSTVKIGPEGDKTIFVATPEDVILSKLERYRRGGEVSDRQWNDVIGVIKIQREDLDYSYMKKWAAALNVSDLLEKAIEEAPSNKIL